MAAVDVGGLSHSSFMRALCLNLRIILIAVTSNKMKLSMALVACDLNPHYLAFWRVVRDSWKNIVGIPCKMILIADEIPADIQDTAEDIIVFKPVAGIHTAFQAQCIRNLYPALIETDGAIIISDIDMIPLDKSYFVDIPRGVSDEAFLSYRGIHHNHRQIWMCYVAALPAIWSEIFGVKKLEDVTSRMIEWNKDAGYDGRHGGSGWFSDQIILYEHVVRWNKDVKSLTDQQTRFHHLDRVTRDWVELNDRLKMMLSNNVYKDFHMPPYKEHQKQIQDIYDFVVSLNA